MELKFTKMHGCGNDYIYLDCRASGLPAKVAEWSVALSPRRSAVGADGIICICPPEQPGSAAAMHIFNADGSEGRMCGNGIRCVAQFLRDHGDLREELFIDTPLDAGAPTKRLLWRGGDCWQVEMGMPRFDPASLPATGFGAGPMLDKPLTVAGKTWQVTGVSVGNPHCVTVVEDVDALDLAKIGPLFENHPAFPERVNTEFVQRLGPTHLKMRVWERGSGETWACGTGATASAAAMVALGLCPADTDLTMDLVGGTLVLNVGAKGATMTGPAATAFVGTAFVAD